MNQTGRECDRYDNISGYCSSEVCPIRIEKKCGACNGKGFCLAPDDFADTCSYCNGTGKCK